MLSAIIEFLFGLVVVVLGFGDFYVSFYHVSSHLIVFVGAIGILTGGFFVFDGVHSVLQLKGEK
jgi:hypothetical protein